MFIMPILYVFSDKMLLPNDAYTFISSCHSTTSWLDHILSTSSGQSLLQDVHVKGDYISSDHLPLCFNVIVINAIDSVYYSSSDDNNNNMCSSGMAPQIMIYTGTICPPRAS